MYKSRFKNGSIVLLGMCCLFFSIPNANVSAEERRNEEKGNIERIGSKDFKKDKEAAKEWAEASYKDWTKNLTSKEKNSLNQLSKDENLKETLNLFGEDFTDFPEEVSGEIKKLKESIPIVEGALNKQRLNLKDSVYLYKNDTLENVFKITRSKFYNGSEVNEELVQELRAQILLPNDGMLNREFPIFNLHDTDNTKSEAITWKIKINPKTASGYIGDGQVMLSKNVGFEINRITTRNVKGISTIQIEGEVMPKNRVQGRYEILERELNEAINAQFGLADDTELVEFRFSGSQSSVVANQGKELFGTLSSQMGYRTVKRTIDFMAANNWKIIFSDIPIQGLQEAYLPKEPNQWEFKDLADTAGYTRFGPKVMLIDTASFFDEGSNLVHNPFNLTLNPFTVTHEFGHVIDRMMGIEEIPKLPYLSESDKFKYTIFGEERFYLTEYGKTTPQEFFAEAFAMIHSPNPKEREYVETHAPDTYSFITEKLDQFFSVRLN